MKKNLLLIIISIVSCSLIPIKKETKAMSKNEFRRSDCNIQHIGINISDTTRGLIVDSVFIRQNQRLTESNSKVFDVYNTTHDTVYLYSGLFVADWINQPYVHQYDKYSKKYIFSLTPLYKNFREMFQVNTSLDVHYNWYSFIELKPNQYYRLRTSIGEKYFAKEQNAIKAIHPKTPYEALKSPFLNLKDQNIKNSIIRLAVYEDISALCEDKPFNEDELMGLQLNFKTISTDFEFWGKEK